MPLSDDVRSGFISGRTFTDKSIQYSVVDGMAFFEGDIVLGMAVDIEARTKAIQDAREATESNLELWGVAITGGEYDWPGAIMPYEIDSNLPNKGRISDAITHWEQNTNVRFVERTESNAGQYPNYLHFRLADDCWSLVGMQGGLQDIGLHGDCGVGDVIHQIGHAYGLWHEQSREDRDMYVKINWENILAGYEHNFNQHVTDGDDIGPYDYDSIMHFPATAFSRSNLPTIEALQGDTALGQRTHLSGGDIAAVYALQVRSNEQPVTHQNEIEQGIDDAFWLDHSKEMIKNAIPAQDKGAETLQKSLAWFWTVYSAAVVIGAALTEKNYPVWVTILIALPSPILVLAYFLASYVSMPGVVRFDPRHADQIQEEHQRVLRYKGKQLRIALMGTLLAAVLVAIALVATSTTPG
jgi:hypothetical protein